MNPFRALFILQYERWHRWLYDVYYVQHYSEKRGYHRNHPLKIKLKYLWVNFFYTRLWTREWRGEFHKLSRFTEKRKLRYVDSI